MAPGCIWYHRTLLIMQRRMCYVGMDIACPLINRLRGHPYMTSKSLVIMCSSLVCPFPSTLNLKHLKHSKGSILGSLHTGVITPNYGDGVLYTSLSHTTHWKTLHKVNHALTLAHTQGTSERGLKDFINKVVISSQGYNGKCKDKQVVTHKVRDEWQG